MKEKEIWQDIAGYEGKYQVSNLGNVKSLNYHREKREHPLSPAIDGKGYLFVTLCKNGNEKKCKVHRLVAEVFLDKKDFKYVDEEDRIANLDLEKLEVNHLIEGEAGKKNNCVDNLEWCTQWYNILYGTGIKRSGKARINHPKRSKKIHQLDLQDNFIKEWPSSAEVQRQTGYCSSCIRDCCNGIQKTAYGYIWKYAN